MEIHSSADLATYIKLNVPGFDQVTLLGPGTGYHYTTHWLEIAETGKFFGAPISAGLHQTQGTPGMSPSAIDPEGIVFAYEDLEKSREEGRGQQIIWVRYHSGVRAMQSAEAERLEALNKKPFSGYTFLIRPTLLIMARDIAEFGLVEE
jgi:hypothetical protein